MIDINEQDLLDLSEKIFNTLLMDRTTKKNICWGTDHYINLGSSYFPQEPITKELVTGRNANVIKPRVAKAIEEQAKRTKDKAEVFTPSWVCNEQNNLIDEAWFGRKNVFNFSNNQTWMVNTEVISFPKEKDWKKYVDAKRLEISCGEAPYLVSRYDTVTGKEITIEQRIGLLDRKLRVVGENTNTEEEWFKWTKRAYESTYGYEYQGDSLLIARENLLSTFVEYMEHKFSKKPTEEQLLVIAKIISWNILQMDGITMCVPFSERPRVNTQISIFDLMDNNVEEEKEAIPAKIFDWRSNKSLEFKELLK